MYLVFRYLNWSHRLVTRVTFAGNESLSGCPSALPEPGPGWVSHVSPPVPPVCSSSCGFVCGWLLRDPPCWLRHSSTANWCSCTARTPTFPFPAPLFKGSFLKIWCHERDAPYSRARPDLYSGSRIVLNPSSLFTRRGPLTPYWTVLPASGFCSLWQHIYYMPQGLCQVSPILRGKRTVLPHFRLWPTCPRVRPLICCLSDCEL